MLTLNDNCGIITEMLRTWGAIVKILKKSLFFPILIQLLLYSPFPLLTHRSPSVPGAGGAQTEGRAGGA